MKILVKNSRADVIVSPDQTSNKTLAGEVSEAQVNSEIALIQSRDLLEAAVKKTGLAKPYLDNNQKESPATVEMALRQLEKDLTISPMKKANIIDVSYPSYSAQQSASVLQAVAELYLERHLQVHRVSGTDEFFKARAADRLLRRFSVKPGLTYLWQISGRSNTGFGHWVKQDLQYIDRWSLGLDLSILMKTVPAVIKGRGAV